MESSCFIHKIQIHLLQHELVYFSIFYTYKSHASNTFPQSVFFRPFFVLPICNFACFFPTIYCGTLKLADTFHNRIPVKTIGYRILAPVFSGFAQKKTFCKITMQICKFAKALFGLCSLFFDRKVRLPRNIIAGQIYLSYTIIFCRFRLQCFIFRLIVEVSTPSALAISFIL